MDKEADLKKVKAELSKCFLLMAKHQLLSEETTEINKAKWLKANMEASKWNDYTEAQQNFILDEEAKTDDEIKAKYGLDSYEAYGLLSEQKTRFNEVALTFSVNHLATKEQGEIVKELLNIDKTHQIIFKDKIFEICSHLDIFLEGITSEGILKEVTL